MASAWTPELKERVAALWVNNSATQIAWVLNGDGYTFSRNAIICWTPATSAPKARKYYGTDFARGAA